MTAEDRLQSIMEVLDIDDNRERIACANLENVDVLGLHEHYDEFIEEIRSRFGWKFEKVPNWFVGNEPWQASDELRQRIAADNAADVRLYKHARRLHAQRRERPGAPLS